MSVVVCCFADELEPARRLAEALGAPLRLIDLRHFPDGESLPTVPTGLDRVILYRSLDRPDAKLMSLLLAVDALRRAGTRRLVLAAPYLCYLRQDAVFQAGQPLSSDVIARLLGERFDEIVTVAPHVHRSGDLSELFGAPVRIVSPAGALETALPGALGLGAEPVLIVGPDAESAPWAVEMARTIGADVLALGKVRLGDCEVRLDGRAAAAAAGRRVVLVDDICSSGATLAAAAGLLIEAGATRVDAAVIHALFAPEVRRALFAAGIARLIWTDSCAHSGAAIPLARPLAWALSEELTA